MKLEERLALERQIGFEEGFKEAVETERANNIVKIYEAFTEVGVSKTDAINKISDKYEMPYEKVAEIIENRQLVLTDE